MLELLLKHKLKQEPSQNREGKKKLIAGYQRLENQHSKS